MQLTVPSTKGFIIWIVIWLQLPRFLVYFLLFLLNFKQYLIMMTYNPTPALTLALRFVFCYLTFQLSFFARKSHLVSEFDLVFDLGN